MSQKTNITTLDSSEIIADERARADAQLSYDFKNAVLIVSVVANLFVLTAWIAVQVTSRYDTQLTNFLFNQ